jgi:hypothetical protein
MWEHVNTALNQATTRIIDSIAGFVPGLLALVVALLFSLLIAGLVKFLLRRSLQGMSFDRRLSEWGLTGLADWMPGRSPTVLITRVVFWTIMVFGVLVGITAFNAEVTSQLSMAVFRYLPNLVVALILLGLGTFLARFLARAVLISAVNMQIHSAKLLSLGVKWLVLVLAAAMALEHMGIGGAIVRLSFGILFGGIVLAMALAVGLGSKDVVSRSWERQSHREAEREEEFHHL